MGDPFLENYMKQRQENRTKAELEIRKQNHQYFTETAKIASETSDALNSIQSESTSELKAIDLSTKKSELQTRKTAEENANKAKRREVEIRSTTRKIKEEVSAVIAKYESDTQLFQDRINSEREFAINEEHSKREVQKVQAADEIKRIRERQAKKIVEITQRKNKKIEKLQKKDWTVAIFQILWKFLVLIWSLFYSVAVTFFLCLFQVSEYYSLPDKILSQFFCMNSLIIRTLKIIWRLLIYIFTTIVHFKNCLSTWVF